MFLSIPKCDLIHTIEVQKYVEGSDGWDNAIEGEKVEYKFVRFVLDTNYSPKAKDAYGIDTDALLYMDCTHTRPIVTKDIIGYRDIITFDNQDYYVVTISPVETRKLHIMEYQLKRVTLDE